MTVPSLLILGTDAVLAASPATPVQLMHACLAAGYTAVVPATWGDELIAARVLERLRQADGPRIQCSCPLVAARLAARADDIAPMLLALVPPPVAAARYLRSASAPSPIHITFAGGCPGAEDDSIDVRLAADDLLRTLAERGIVVTAQPTEFDAVLPPDRRRFYSDPGGVPLVPAPEHGVPLACVDVGADDLVPTLAQHLLQSLPVLLNVAPAVGCRCSGVVDRADSASARSRVRALEPPRALGPVVDHALVIDLDAVLPALSNPASGRELVVEPVQRIVAAAASGAPAAPAVRVAPTTTSPPPATVASPAALTLVQESSVPAIVAMEVPPNRLSQRLSRPVLANMPHTRTETGRQLPRAFVARRRSSPPGMRAQTGRPSQPRSRQGRLVRWYVVAATIASAGLILVWLFQWGP